MNEAPRRYVTLRDAGRLLRQHAILIVAVAAVCTAAAVGIASQLPKKYSAQAQLTVQDTSQAAALAGTPVIATQTPAEAAAQAASTLVTPRLIAAVRHALGLTRPISQIQSWVSAQADSTSNLVQVNVSAPTGRLAASVANATARIAAAEQAAQARATYAAAIRRLTATYRASNPTNDPASRAIFEEKLSNLEALDSVASPLRVVALASVPTSPSSPKIAQDGVLGLVLGVLLGVLMAVIRTAVDRRLRGADDVLEVAGLPLLGQVRETALGYAGDVPRGDEQLHPRDLEGFHMLRANTEFLSSNGSGAPRTFAVTSALAEEGKSTTAAALAFAYAASGRRTLLAECDLRVPCLATRLGIPPNGGLTSYLLGESSFSEVVYLAQPSSANHSGSAPESHQTLAGAAATSGVEGSDIPQNGSRATFAARPDIVVAGLLPSHPVELLASPTFRQFLTEAKAAYDIVILDTAPVLSVADTLEILPHVEGVVLCVRAARTTRDQVAACAGALRTLPAKPAGVVVTGLSDREDARYGYYGYGY